MSGLTHRATTALPTENLRGREDGSGERLCSAHAASLSRAALWKPESRERAYTSRQGSHEEEGANGCRCKERGGQASSPDLQRGRKPSLPLPWRSPFQVSLEKLRAQVRKLAEEENECHFCAPDRTSRRPAGTTQRIQLPSEQRLRAE